MNKKALAIFVIALMSITAAMAKDFRTVVFKVEQMECGNCERKVKNNIRFEKGVKEFTTDLGKRTVTVVFDADKTNVEKLKAGFRKFKYEAVEVKEDCPAKEKK